MNLIIRFLTVQIARQIESGSRIGAFIGTFLGIAVAIFVWTMINSIVDSETLRFFKVADYIIASVIGGMLGAMAGGRLIPSSAPLPKELVRQVRIYRLNETVAFLILSLFLLGIFILCFFVKNGNSKEPPMSISEKTLMMGAILLASFGLMFYFCRQVICISISEQITLRKALSIIDITANPNYFCQLDLAGGPDIENVTGGILSISIKTKYVLQKKLTANECRDVVLVKEKFKHQILVR